ncbi:MAG: hypothetical protein DHS20C21_08430 [Gemmatimonadota bacterium]|nr:MAG: hypothetical protein DHS20C21_08430 [Gemmatimonadota bacterium]
MKRFWIPGLVALLALTTGCNGGSSPTGPTGGTGMGTLTATVDGVDWTAPIVSAVHMSGAVVITGADASVLSVQIQFLDTDSGTIAVSPSTPASGTVQQTGDIWSTSASGGTGAIELLEFTATGARGTFSFTTGTHNSASPTERLVTNGTFHVTF